MENVEGLLLGNAKAYVERIYQEFHNIGYRVNHWLLCSEKMGVPQKRHRVFFIAIRDDIDFDLYSLNMEFDYLPIVYGEIKEGELRPMEVGSIYYNVAVQAIDSDRGIADTRERLGELRSAFQVYYIRNDEIMWTQRTRADVIDIDELSYVSWDTIRNAQTFPRDFDFMGTAASTVGYICGMSVPPVMIKRIVTRLIESGLFKYKGL